MGFEDGQLIAVSVTSTIEAFPPAPAPAPAAVMRSVSEWLDTLLRSLPCSLMLVESNDCPRIREEGPEPQEAVLLGLRAPAFCGLGEG